MALSEDSDLMLGWNLYYLSLTSRNKFVETLEDDYTWVNETLTGIKSQFSSPEIQLLPKTPSSKKARQAVRRKKAQVIIEEEDENVEKEDKTHNEETPPPKKTRRTRTTREQTSATTTAATRSTRTTRASARANTTVQQQPIEEPREPVFSFQNSLIKDIIEISSPAIKSKSTAQIVDAQTSSCTIVHSVSTPKTVKIQIHSPKQNTPKLQSPANKNSPKNIPGFRHLSVKEKAQAFEGPTSSVVSNSPSVKLSIETEPCKPVLDTPPKSPDEELQDESVQKSETNSHLRLSKRMNLRSSNHLSPVKTKHHTPLKPQSPVPPARSTRSKLRVDKKPQPTLDSPVAPQRCTRSKVRKNQQPPKLDTPDSEDNTPPTRSKLAQKQAANNSLSGSKRPLEQQDRLSPPKKQRLEKEVESSDNSDNDIVDGTPSPKDYKSLKSANGQRQPTVMSFLGKSALKRSINPGMSVTSFIKRNTPQKVTLKEEEERKRRDLQAKESSAAGRQRQRRDMLSKRAEEMKKKREERMRMVAKRREEQKRQEDEQKKKLLTKLDDKVTFEEKIQEDREKLRQQREKKLAEVKLRRKVEEEARLQKLLEKEELARQQEELQHRKREYEEAERQRRLAEQHKLDVLRRAEAEQQAARHREQIRKEEEAQHRKLLEQRRIEEERLKREQAERQRQEIDKQRERDRLRQEELARQREVQHQKVQIETQKQKQQTEDEKRIQVLIDKHNHALKQNTSINTAPPVTNSNTSFTVQEGQSAVVAAAATEHNPDSYDITPTRVKKVKSKHMTAENYCINNLASDDSTDDESAPRKRIPNWAQGAALKAALINQHYKPPNLDDIFDIIEPPDLTKVFVRQRACFVKRTSSAHWDSPILKPSGKLPD